MRLRAIFSLPAFADFRILSANCLRGRRAEPFSGRETHMSELPDQQRENWGSRTGFVLAAIGSAVGLGNLWGFPYKLYSFGGGAFLIPYLLAMLLIGIPVLILEFSLGHMTQRAAPDAFRRTGGRTELIGWWGILLGFVIITYYAVILAWCLSFLWYCLKGIFVHGGALPWSAEGEAGVAATREFFGNYLNAWSADDPVKPWTLGSISPEIAFSLGLIWTAMFFCIFRGVRIVSKVVLWTVPLPWLMLLILTVRGLTLPGAAKGLAYYLEPDWGQLAKPTTWRFAFGQVFFSMSLAFGVMITYASFLHRKSDLNNNATIIGLSDLSTSFVAGIAVFATLGAMSFVTAQNVDVVAPSGPDLAFVAFPYALAQLPYPAWFGTVFFVALLTLGIDSAFSITESVLASLTDKTGWNRTAVLWGMTFVGFCAGLVYCSRGGLSWLGNIDGWINGPWGITLLGLLQCVVLGWAYRIGRLREHANERSEWRLGVWWDWTVRVIVPVLLSALFVWTLYDTVTDKTGYLVSRDGDLNVPAVVGLALAAVAPLLALALSLIRSRGGERIDAGSPPAPASRDARQTWGAALAVVALLIAALAGWMVCAAKLDVNEQVPPSEAINHFRLAGKWLLPTPGAMLLAGMACGLVAIVFGSAAVGSAERAHRRPTKSARLSGAFGTVAFGCNAGLFLAMWVMLAGVDPGSVRHGDEMTAAGYLLTGAIILLIVGGLGWCFYRAIKAASSTETDAQLPEANNGSQ